MPNYSTISNDANTYPLAVTRANAAAVPCPNMPVADIVPVMTEQQMRISTESLKAQGFSEGLLEAISRNLDIFPLRIWVLDNSKSMDTRDGHRLSGTSGNFVKLLDCSRWAEILDTVTYHAQVAALLEAPTQFRLLNPSGSKTQFSVAERGPEHTPEDLRNVLNSFREMSPGGVTPLAERVVEIASLIESMKHQLIPKGQKVVVTIATDGLPSDERGRTNPHTMNEFKNALRSLEGLPVWVVIRLCTDDEKVVNFYNNIDCQLELSVDVLDDFFAEAQEVHEHNKWLTYALPLHRMREMGFYHKLFDLIDERALTRDELKDFFLLIYGANALDGIPDPQIEWPKFLDRIAAVTSKEKMQFNPVNRRRMPWVDIQRLDIHYGDQVDCTC